MKKLDLYAGIIVCIYVASINIIFGKVAFSLPIFLLGVSFIVFHYIKEKIYQNNKLYKYFKAFRILLVVGILVWSTIFGTIVFYPKNDTSTVDYLIVLGAGINGEEISLTLKQRLDKAIEFVTEYDTECMIVLSGGQGPGEDITESEAMRRYLIENGIDENRIFKEERSTSTSENLKFSKPIIEEHANKGVEDLSIKIISSDFHIFRSSILAKRNSYEEVTFLSNKTFAPIAPITYIRETVAVVKSVLFDKGEL